MAKFLCDCGATIRTSGEIPNPDEWHLVADRDVETDAAAAVGGGAGSFQFRAPTDRFRFAYVCPTCGGLWILWDGFDGPGTFYAKREDVG